MRIVLLDIVGLLCLLGCLAVVSCAQRIGFDQPIPQPVVDSMTVQITPIWNTDARPDRLNVLLYDASGALYKEVPLPVEGGAVTVVRAAYRVIVYNPNSDRVVFGRMERFAEASGRVAWLSKVESKQIDNPGALYSAAFDVPMGDVMGTVEVRQSIKQRSVGVTIKLGGEEAELALAERATIHLRNIADGINLSTGKAYHTSDSDGTESQLSLDGVVQGIYMFVGATFGSCLSESCGNLSEHRIYADIEATAADGTLHLVSADITEAIRSAQESATTISVDITIKRLWVGAVVTGWTTGVASGTITDELR